MDLDASLDRLYAVTPAGFVDTRDELVRRAKEEGDRQAAEQLGQQRKPTLAAWAVNQVVRRRRDDVEQLLEVGDGLRDHADDAEALRSGTATLRELTRRLRDEAATQLERLGTDPSAHLDEVERTLTTAAVDPDAREPVAAGRLVRPLPAAGFSALGVLPEPVAGADAGASSQRRGDQRRARELRRQVQGLERHRDRLRRELDEAEQQVEEIAARLGDAQRRAGEGRDRLRDAESEVERVRGELEEAEAAR